MEESKREFKGPYIKEKEMFKALNFARHMITQGDDEYFAVCKSAKYYKVSPHELAYELLRAVNWEKTGGKWQNRETQGGTDGNQVPEQANSREVSF